MQITCALFQKSLSRKVGTKKSVCLASLVCMPCTLNPLRCCCFSMLPVILRQLCEDFLQNQYSISEAFQEDTATLLVCLRPPAAGNSLIIKRSWTTAEHTSYRTLAKACTETSKKTPAWARSFWMSDSSKGIRSSCDRTAICLVTDGLRRVVGKVQD